MFSDTQLYLRAVVTPQAPVDFFIVSFLFSCFLRLKLTGRVNSSWANMLKGLSRCVCVPFKTLIMLFAWVPFLCH